MFMPELIISRVWRHPSVMRTILRHTPVLDPLVILCNSALCISIQWEIMAFVAIKKYCRTYELGTVYTYPKHRRHGYASWLITYVVERYQPIGLLCKKDMIPFYEKLWFEQEGCEPRSLSFRRKLFNIFLQPLRWYPLVSMVYNSKKSIR